MTHISEIVTIFLIPKANFSTVALLPCDYLLVYLSDIVTILPSSRGSHNIQCGRHIRKDQSDHLFVLFLVGRMRDEIKREKEKKSHN